MTPRPSRIYRLGLPPSARRPSGQSRPGRRRCRPCRQPRRSWVYREQDQPWKAYHEARGIMDERAMMRAQLHDYGDINPGLAGVPGIWCWPQGGHYDNPTATRETWAFYQTQLAHFSAAERAVRAHGGFRDF